MVSKSHPNQNTPPSFVKTASQDNYLNTKQNVNEFNSGYNKNNLGNRDILGVSEKKSSLIATNSNKRYI
jgi:hypothetical protein